MASSSSLDLDSVRVLSRCLLLSESIDVDRVDYLISKVLPAWEPERTNNNEWSLARRSHRVAIKFSPLVIAGPVEIPQCDHSVDGVVMVTASDLQAEAAAWVIARALATMCKVSWFDGVHLVDVPPASELISIVQPEHPQELWSTFRVLLAGNKMPNIEFIAGAIDSIQSSSIVQGTQVLRARLLDRNEIEAMRDAEQLRNLDTRLAGGMGWGLDVEVLGVPGYACGIDLAKALSKRGLIVWHDELNQTGLFDEGIFRFDNQLPTPDGVLYLRQHINEWVLAEGAMAMGGERQVDTHGRARWKIDTADGPLHMTLEHDGVVETMVSAESLRWLEELGGPPASVVLFEAPSQSAFDTTCGIVLGLTENRRGYWLSVRSAHGYLGTEIS